ncbi:LacI family DNA-binding transcriptional regulator [uncultured Paraglaciecola sp.]|uniref:LacI family DNA-binding transcriptional regulator n=1 Tax=uncultured Paraglaciecola sp. TaxID=1765024 RepID=UPI0030DC31DA|tara:strand:- start:29836 stop:30840 length:1005 start_codon:yes stop_codon:yes gene_type:complete
MTTLKDIAKAAGVSHATVSRVVNNGPKVGPVLRAKINKLIKEMGYRPNANARALVTQKSTTIGVVIPDVADPFFATLANGIDKISRQLNMQMLISTGKLSAESEREAINLLLERRCETIVIHSKMIGDEELIELFNAHPHFVLIDRYIAEIEDKCVWLDNQEGGKIAARHLLSLKHQQLACITSSYDIEDPKLRLRGFVEELGKANITLDSQRLVRAEPTLQGGEIATQKLLASGQAFSAIFVYNDAMAIGAISTLEDNGYSVPNDVSIIGFDDVLLARYSRPKLTTLQYPIDLMAQNAAQLALRIHQEPTMSSDKLKFIPQLIKRESTSRYLK